jgi:hypothetical protein
MKAPLPAIAKVHEEAQIMLMNYETDEVHANNAITRMALRKYSNNSGMSKEVFFTNEDATS